MAGAFAVALVLTTSASAAAVPPPALAQSSVVEALGTEPVEYVNLGDSFSAGTGVFPVASGSFPNCWQSERNFAHLVAADRGYRLTDVSCGGAKTDDFTRSQYPGLLPQLDALSPTTDLVTMMIGGNDNNTFARAIAQCVEAAASRPDAWNPCEERYGDDLSSPVRTQTYPALVQALRDVHTRAPDAEVVIVGYPWLLPPTDGCPAQMPMAPGDVPYLYALQVTLNDAVRRAADETGTTYVDMSQASAARDGCQPADRRWIEPLIGAVQPVPVHPNAVGERALADAVLDTIGTR